MEYKASLDTLAKVITLCVFVVLALIGRMSVKALFVAGGDTVLVLFHSGIILLFILIIAFSYLFSTQSYAVENGNLIIKRPIGDRIISINDVVEIHPVEKGEMTGTIRTFGVGGLFGYYGKYYNKRFGSLTLYTTQRHNRIFIRTKSGDKIII